MKQETSSSSSSLSRSPSTTIGGSMLDSSVPLVMLSQFVVKVGVEVVFTPVTYKIVGWLKRAEQEDYYDRNTDFNPFTLKT